MLTVRLGKAGPREQLRAIPVRIPGGIYRMAVVRLETEKDAVPSEQDWARVQALCSRVRLAPGTYLSITALAGACAIPEGQSPWFAAGAQDEAVVMLFRMGEFDGPSKAWMERWQEEVVKAGGAKMPLEQHRYNDNTRGYDLNCADDAFRVATFVLWDCSKRFGTKSALFRNWLNAQSVVFETCVGEEKPLPALPANPPRWLEQDRDYQQAAWHFYLGRNEQALREFQQIAADKTSQWQEISRYLVVRTLTRIVQQDPKQYPRAQAEIEAILKDPSARRIHSAVRTLERRNDLATQQPPCKSKSSPAGFGTLRIPANGVRLRPWRNGSEHKKSNGCSRRSIPPRQPTPA